MKLLACFTQPVLPHLLLSRVDLLRPRSLSLSLSLSFSLSLSLSLSPRLRSRSRERSLEASPPWRLREERSRSLLLPCLNTQEGQSQIGQYCFCARPSCTL